MRICSTNATRLAKQHTESQPGEPLFDHFDREPVVSQRIGMLWGPGTALALGVDGCHCLSSLVGQRQPEVPVDICHRTQRIGNQVVVVHVVELGRQARQTATQITAAATGFEQAFAMTVPPPAIMANRAQVLSLIATNFFGQNTAAIAALETQYAEMWEQDATAMYDYAATSAAARTLTPFTSPQQDTNSAGLPAQSAEVSRATANAGAADGNWLGNLLEEIGILLLPIAPELTPFFLEAGEIVNAIPFPSIVGDEFCLLDGLLAWYATIGSINNINSMGTGIIGAEKNLGILPELGSAAAAAAPPPADIAPAFLAPLTSMAKSLSDGALRGPGEVSAAMRGAGTIGQMSVPPAWKAPAVTTVRAFDATPMTTLPGGDAPAAGVPGLPGMPASGAGRAGVVPRYGVRLTVMTRPLSGG